MIYFLELIIKKQLLKTVNQNGEIFMYFEVFAAWEKFSYQLRLLSNTL